MGWSHLAIAIDDAEKRSGGDSAYEHIPSDFTVERSFLASDRLPVVRVAAGECGFDFSSDKVDDAFFAGAVIIRSHALSSRATTLLERPGC
jgi:hypothetical protein